MTTTIAELNVAERAGFVTALGHLFEHSPWVVEETWERRPFRDAAQLHSALCATLRAASQDRKLALIRAHPDLAGRLAQQNKLTAASTSEQAIAGLNKLEPAELSRFQKLNYEYRARFGFPFIICARLNDRPAILAAMQLRMTNTPAIEVASALAEIEKIAQLRLDDVLKAPDPTPQV
ncbi:MAG TPA: 2-oxo-4-hydroxy-4-carboxy-5-ureidoimidazoline decarboxylase [Opitutaceae bacterium]|nr:2-oxo-4-hydroxy-4-carboxy-5-ureidoimidazoline decarboxylase [Opitutaceae bacterium]